MSDYKIVFEDFSKEVIEKMHNQIVAGLHTAAGEVVEQTVRNTPTDTGQLKNSWRYIVDENKLTATIGSPLENALWTEFGTGSYAEGGKGRKGYWVYVKGSSNSGLTPKGGKTYTLEDAKKVMAMLRAKGLDAHITNGKKPVRMLRNAFNTKKGTVNRIMANSLKGMK